MRFSTLHRSGAVCLPTGSQPASLASARPRSTSMVRCSPSPIGWCSWATAGLRDSTRTGSVPPTRRRRRAPPRPCFRASPRTTSRAHFWPVCQAIRRDNAIGKTTFAASRLLQHMRFARRAVLRMTRREQTLEGSKRDMSQVLWDMFTGSAPYQEILTRTLRPRFLTRLGWELLTSPVPKKEISTH